MNDPMIDGLVQIIKALKPSERKKLMEWLIETQRFSENGEGALIEEHGGKHPLPRSRPPIIKRKGAKAPR